MILQGIPFLVRFFSVIAFSILIGTCSAPEITLTDLQREILTARTKADTLNVLKKLDDYYLNMEIPNDIRQEVKFEVDGLIQQFDPEEFVQDRLDSAEANLDGNIYIVEYRMRDIVRNAMLALYLNEKATFHNIIDFAENVADTIKQHIGDNYWRPWLIMARQFNKEQAYIWLASEQASLFCFANYTGDYEKGEKFAAFGLQLLEMIEDNRLKSDLAQGILVILYKHYSFFDLAIPLFEDEIQQSEPLSDRKRLIGLISNYGEALHKVGKNYKALINFELAFNRTKEITKLPGLNWYANVSLIGLARANWELGNYHQALSICLDVEKRPLGAFEQYFLYNTKGIVYRTLGEYDKAEAEYDRALYFSTVANDTINQINILYNKGEFKYRLSEYDEAKYYFDRALDLLLIYNPKDMEYQSSILIQLAAVEVAQNRIDKFNSYIKKARELISLSNIPFEKGRFLISLGELETKAEHFSDAYNYFFKADSIFEVAGLLRKGLESKTKLVETLISLSELTRAKKHLHDLKELAEKISDSQGQINAVGLGAQISFMEGNVDKAIQISNRLIYKIEYLSQNFSNLDNLATFRQKIIPYLRKTVIYELAKGRIDSAFVKLDYIKARDSKHRLTQRLDSLNQSIPFTNLDSVLAKCSNNSILIDYFLSKDTLFAFTIIDRKLKLYKKAIKIDELRKICNAYISYIDKGRSFFDPYQHDPVTANYDTLKSYGQKLFHILFGWPELQASLMAAEIAYIIPDDILHIIPFSCLTDLDTNNSEFLIQKFAVVNLPSAFFLQTFQSKISPKNIYDKKVLICADREEFPDAENLIDYIKDKFPNTEELVINKPSIEHKDVLKKLAGDFDLYFLIGHSVPNTKFPDLSYFQFTPIRERDQKPIRLNITLNELKSINWTNTEMVFLVGCETAIGKLYQGSGFSGFQQNILSRGASGVMASLWKIDNKTAFRQIEEFLDLWEDERRPAIALQDVERKWIQQLQKDAFYKIPHPFLWKNFSLIQTTSIE